MRRIKYLTLLGAAGLAATVFPAEAKRMVFYEKFTNTGCNQCAKFAPASDSLVNMRIGDVVSMTYHGNYPFARDPFYMANKEAIDKRISLYGISGYPSVVIDGKTISHSVPAIDIEIEKRLSQPQRLDVAIDSKTEGGRITVKATVKTLAALEAVDPRLFVAVMEEDVRTDPAPNGQTEFVNEFRFLMNDDISGYPLVSLSEAGKTQDVSFSKEIVNVVDSKELAVVAWVQDMSTMEVIEAAYIPRPARKERSAVVLTVEDAPVKICTPVYKASGLFRNTGSEPIEKCNICVEINGSVHKTAWSGKLAYMESAPYKVEEFTDFDLAQGTTPNKVSIYISDINGTSDIGDVRTSGFENAVEAREAVQLTLYTDNKPEETTWQLFNSSGVMLDQSGPLTEKRHFYRHVFNLKADDCYVLKFTDTGGDGIAGDNGNGYYTLAQYAGGKRKVIAQTDFRTGEHSVSFMLRDANPASGVETAEATAEALGFDARSGKITVGTGGVLRVVRADGIVAATRVFDDAGQMDVAGFQPGVYVISLETPETTLTKTVRVR